MEQREDQKTRIKTILVICSMLLVLGGVCTPQISSFFGQKSAETIGAAGEQKRGIREQKDAKKQDPEEDAEKKDYIKWVDFNVCTEALRGAYKYDVDTYGTKCHLNWIELLSYLAVGYGGDFRRYKSADMDAAAKKIQEQGIETITADMEYYSYYHETYEAVLGGMVGEYETEAALMEQETSGRKSESVLVKKYGIKAFAPIAKGFPYSHYDDFGASRSYGYRRNHLGHDMMGQVGTPTWILNRTKGHQKVMSSSFPFSTQFFTICLTSSFFSL